MTSNPLIRRPPFNTTLLHSSVTQQIPHNSFILLFFPFFVLLESIWSKLDRFTCECSGVRMSWQYPKGLGRQPRSDAHGRPFTISGSSSFVSVMMLHQFLKLTGRLEQFTCEMFRGPDVHWFTSRVQMLETDYCVYDSHTHLYIVL